MASLEHGARTALVVDDEPVVLELLDDILVEAGFATTCFGLGQPAVEALAQHRFDLLVVDLGLPDMNGMRICMEARDRYGDDVAILIVTADGRKERRIAALELGADDVVGKPFAVDELLARIIAKLRRISQFDSSPESN